MHGGFTDNVTDFSWNRNDPWVMAAAAEDNQMQIFKPARALVEMPKEEVLNREIDE
jgi:histone-binding protein RBBP4